MSHKGTLRDETMKLLVKSQRDEATDALIYERIAAREKDEKNRKILKRLAQDERDHAQTWAGYTGRAVHPDRLRLLVFWLLSILLGYTFVLKRIQMGEQKSAQGYAALSGEIPQAAKISQEEHGHENALIGMLDEERLQYVGSMVLGLNDALVELTGTIAGLTFAMANTRLIALSGIITGISATLSMGASNYLAERAAGNRNALKSSFYTGIAYLVTVALLVLPYLLYPETLYIAALITMLAAVILIILVFNYYISVAKSQPFLRRFAEMAAISLSVAAISFLIGILVKQFLGIDIG